MSEIFVYLLFSFLALCTVVHSSVPLFLWSGKGYFSDTTEPHTEVNGLLQLDHFIKEFMVTFSDQKSTVEDTPKNVQDSLMNYVSKTQEIMPEVVVAFIYSQLDSAATAQQPLSFLKNVLTESKSSLIVPHVLTESSSAPASVQLVDLFSALTPKTEIVALQLDDDENEIAGCKALMEQLHSNQQIFSNLETDLIMVKADEFKNGQGDCMTTILRSVNTLTSGHYLGMLTADTSRTDIIKSFSVPSQTSFNSFSAPQIRLQKPIIMPLGKQEFITVSADVQADDYPGVLYLSPNILFALLYGIMFLLVVVIAVNCLVSIETPQRLTHRRYNIGKES